MVLSLPLTVTKSSEDSMITTRFEPDTSEQQRLRHKASFAEDDCVEILRRAFVEQTDEPWFILQGRFSETIRIWIRCHPSSDVALLRDSEENYIAQTFSRFWYAVRQQSIEFTTTSAVLCYLHATVNGLMIDTLRSHLRSCTRDASLPPEEFAEESSAEELFESKLLWESIESLLCDKRERRLFYLLYYCGLKPKEVISLCPNEFDDVKEIYRLNNNIIKRLRRSIDRLRYLLGDE